MSDNNALVERMGAAVRTAYKAMEVLKVENQNLKAENEALRQQLLLLGGVNLSDRAVEDIPEMVLGSPLTLAIDEIEVTEEAEEVEVEASLSIQKPERNASVTKEYGVSFIKVARLENAPQASTIASILSQLQLSNLHEVARHVSPCSPDTLCKALCISLDSYLNTAEVLQPWVTNVSMSMNSPVSSLIPTSLLGQLDLLASVLVSLSSRCKQGLIVTQKLVESLLKVIIGGIRSQLSAMHYAQVMGTVLCNSAASTSAGIGNGGDQVDFAEDYGNTKDDADEDDDISDSGVSSDSEESSVSVASDDEDNDVDDDENAVGNAKSRTNRSSRHSYGKEENCEEEQGDKQQRKAALSSMFGLDSSDSGSDSGGEMEQVGADINIEREINKVHREESDGDADVYCAITDDNAMLASDDDDEEGQEQEQGGGYSAVNSAAPVAAQMLGPGASAASPKKKNTERLTAPNDLIVASRVYLLLSTLLRLRLFGDLVRTLKELWLVTPGNLSRGAILAVAQVFGSERFKIPSQAVRTQLGKLLRAWHTDLSSMPGSELDTTAAAVTSTAIATSAPVAAEIEVCGDGILLHGLIEKVWARLGHKETLAQLLVTPTSASAASDSAEPALLGTYDCQLPAQFRKLGFWGSVRALLRGKTHTSEATEDTTAAVECFGAIGLDGVEGHAESLCDILLAWSPAALTTWAKCASSVATEAPSTVYVSGFVQSPSYAFSQTQHGAHQVLYSSKISTTKLVAEEVLVTQFAAYWSTRLAAVGSSAADTGKWKQAKHSVRTVSLLLDTFLSTEYDGALGGWRAGSSGDAFRLSSRLENRLAVAEAALKKLPPPWVPHTTPSSAHLPLQPSLQWLHYSSLTGRRVLFAAELVDHCWKYLFSPAAYERNLGQLLNSSDSSSPEDRENATAARKLHAACTELVCLLALSSAESFISILTCSLRGFLSAFRCRVSSISSTPTTAIGEAIQQFVQEALRSLVGIPAPWSGSVRADIQYEVQLTLRALSASCVSQLVPPSVKDEYCRFQAEWLAQQGGCLPVFVVNLDHRTDRWRRMVVMLSSSGLSAVRVRAFDGTGNNTIDFSNYDSQQSVGVTTTATAPTGSDGLASPHLQTITADDLYTDIPESDVQLTWDSTLNAKFDQRYLPNPAVLSTPSERACAASHLRVWRAIAALCGIKSARSKVSQAVVKAKRQQSATSAAAAAGGGGGGGVDNDNDQLVTAPPDGIFKSLHQLHKCALGTSHVLTSAPPRPTEPFPAAAKSSSVDMADQFLSPQEGVDYFLVLEDDVSFPQQSLVNLRATVRALMRALPADVDILYLGGVLPKETPQFKLKHKKDEPFYSVNYVWTLQAYVLRPRAVEILLSKLPIWAPVDNFVSGMIYNKEIKAHIVVDKMVQKLTTESLGGMGKRNDSDVRPSGKSYVNNFIQAPPSADQKRKGGGLSAKKTSRRKRVKLALF